MHYFSRYVIDSGSIFILFFLKSICILQLDSFLIGSGLVVLSLHPIENILFHRYTLNGYPIRIDHGDWLCGKGVALAVLRVGRLQVNVYTTHVYFLCKNFF